MCQAWKAKERERVRRPLLAGGRRGGRDKGALSSVVKYFAIL